VECIFHSIEIRLVKMVKIKYHDSNLFLKGSIGQLRLIEVTIMQI
jgi:hypothetical protein